MNNMRISVLIVSIIVITLVATPISSYATSGNPNFSNSKKTITALFLNVHYVGQTKIPFSNPAAFKSSPLIKILVSKALGITKLSDGCPDIGLYYFNQSTGHWQTYTKPIRYVAIDKPGECGFTLATGHFSKFAVGGVAGGGGGAA